MSIQSEIDRLTEARDTIRTKLVALGLAASSAGLDDLADAISTITAKTSSNLTASGATVKVPAGYYATEASKSVATATQATPSISIDSAGKITASATQTAGYVAAGTKSATKQLTTKAATTFSPSTSAQTIAAGTYLTGAQTIAATTGTAAVGNVLKGKTFNSANGIGLTGTMTDNGAVSQTLGINGSYTIPAGYHNGSGKVTQSITTKAAATYGAKTTAQTISAGQYLSGAQTIAAVTQTNLAAENIVKGVTVTVASNGSNIFSVTGTREIPSANAATAATFQMNYTGGYSYKAATSCAAYGSAAQSSTAGYVTLPAGTYRVVGFGYVDGDSNSKGFWISKQGAVSSNLVKGSVMNSSYANEFVIDTTLTLTASTTVTLVMYSSETGYGRRGAASIFRVS